MATSEGGAGRRQKQVQKSATIKPSADDNDYCGYTVRQNRESGRWVVYWRDKRIDEDFASRADAEDWIDEQIPLNR